MPDVFAGSTEHPILTDAPIGIADELSVGLRTAGDKTIVVPASNDGITEVAFTTESRYTGTVEIPDDTTDGSYEYYWLRGTDEVGTEFITIGSITSASFASANDIARRLGRDLTDTEQTQVETLLPLAADAITDAVGRTATWATSISPVPGALRAVSIEAVARVLLNPAGARSTSETLGAHSYSQSFTDGTTGLLLTDVEERRVRRAVYGTNSGSVRVGSLADMVVERNLLGARYGDLAAEAAANDDTA